MIAKLTRTIAADLRGFPVDVYYGKERFSQGPIVDNRIEVREVGPEAWGPPSVTRDSKQPAHWCNWVAVAVLFEIASTKGGSAEEDHKRECREVLDAFACSLLKHTNDQREPIRGGAMSGQFIDDEATPLESGARYLLTFSIAKSVTKPIAAAADSPVPAGTVTVNDEQQTPAED